VPIDDPKDSGTPFAFDISMGVRKGDTELKARLESALDRKHDEIKAILDDFGVPLLPLPAPTPESGPGTPGNVTPENVTPGKAEREKGTP
jgi:mxaJ protein